MAKSSGNKWIISMETELDSGDYIPVAYVIGNSASLSNSANDVTADSDDRYRHLVPGGRKSVNFSFEGIASDDYTMKRLIEIHNNGGAINSNSWRFRMDQYSNNGELIRYIIAGFILENLSFSGEVLSALSFSCSMRSTIFVLLDDQTYTFGNPELSDSTPEAGPMPPNEEDIVLWLDASDESTMVGYPNNITAWNNKKADGIWSTASFTGPAAGIEATNTQNDLTYLHFPQGTSLVQQTTLPVLEFPGGGSDDVFTISILHQADTVPPMVSSTSLFKMNVAAADSSTIDYNNFITSGIFQYIGSGPQAFTASSSNNNWNNYTFNNVFSGGSGLFNTGAASVAVSTNKRIGRLNITSAEVLNAMIYPVLYAEIIIWKGDIDRAAIDEYYQDKWALV